MAAAPELSPVSHSGRPPESLADILERVLDKGVVIAGDIVVNILDIELLTLKLRLLVASVDTAKEMGIDWWQDDPFLSRDARSLQQENQQLQQRLEQLEAAITQLQSETAQLGDGTESGGNR